MAINYATGVKAARLGAVLTAMNAGAGAGKLQICTAAYAAVLVEFDLSETDQNVADNILELVASPITEAAVATGTAAIARLVDSNDAVVANGLTVGTSASDVIVDSVSITTAQNVTLNAATITHAA